MVVYEHFLVIKHVYYQIQTITFARQEVPQSRKSVGPEAKGAEIISQYVTEHG